MKIEFDKLLEKAAKFHGDNIKWHFHILTPTCSFNDNGETFSIILENDETGEKWTSLFASKPLREGEKLERLFYGRV